MVIVSLSSKPLFESEAIQLDWQFKTEDCLSRIWLQKNLFHFNLICFSTKEIGYYEHTVVMMI